MPRASNFVGELLHTTGVRLRIVGNGNLKQYLHSLQDVNNFQMVDHVLQNPINREKVTLANFIDQRVQYELKTTELNEWFRFSKIVIFVKPIATGYPQ
jgi:hypothetical protein